MDHGAGNLVRRSMFRGVDRLAADASRWLTRASAKLGLQLGRAARTFVVQGGRAAALAGRRMPRIARPESLKIQLTVGSAFVASVILFLTYFSVTGTAHKIAAEQTRKRLAERQRSISSILAESIAANDRLQVNLLSKTFLESGVEALLVRDRDGSILYDSDPAKENAFRNGARSRPSLVAAGTLETVDVGGKTFLHGASPIRFGTTAVGTLDLWLNGTDLEAEILREHSFVYPILALGFLLMLALAVGALQIPFRALRRLAAAAERIQAGDLSERVPISGRDEVAAFCQAFNRMVDGLSKAQEEILRRHLETIRAMISAVEAKDSYTQGHCVRVQDYTARILEHFPGISISERRRIETSALLHDIGKIGIPDEILLKEGRLSKKEMAVVRTHVLIGEKILQHLDSMRDIAHWIRHHHERWDGLGYPDGLRSDKIPFPSRVIAVADCIDAMLTDRPYRKALTREKVWEALEQGSETQFDPAIVKSAVAFLKTEEPAPQEAALAHATE
jgi:HD-GYP domain-containing protein (c-di-GMP phosphodiesterase class II)